MGYSMSNGRFANTRDVAVLPPAARTATFNGPAIEVGDLGVVCLDLAVSAVSGTSPTLDVTIETSKDGTTWRAIAAFAQKTTAVSERKSFSGCDRFIRAAAVIGGTTPSFNFSISGEGK